MTQDDETTALLSISVSDSQSTSLTLSLTETEMDSNNNSNNNNSLDTTNSQTSTSYGAIRNNINISSNNINDNDDNDNDGVDIEEGERGGGDNNRESSSSNNNDDDNNNNNNNETNNNNSNDSNSNSNNNNNNEEEEGDGEESPTRDGPIGNLTRRLRCLFSTITWPIVPLGTIVSLAFLWVLYAASVLDLRKSCSHPLHSYALISLVLVAYIPNHSHVRSHLFQYSRERDGPLRPTRVRMYDQFFHTVCLLYVYTGVTLVQTCREDAVDINSVENNPDGPLNTCEATCPNLYQALSVYVATLELFTFALILPLLFLPCIYLWFLQRATEEADALAQFQDRLQEEEALLRNGGVTTGQILDNLERVKIVSRSKSKERPVIKNNSSFSSAADDTDIDTDTDSEHQLWVVPYSETCTLDSSPTTVAVKSDVNECCICMSEFHVHEAKEEDEEEIVADLENGLIEDKNDEVTINKNDGGNRDNCSNDGDSSGVDEDNNSKTCVKKESIIVRTKCGHVFHHDCLKGWVGGKWSLNSTNNTIEIINHNWRRRKARKIFCPLCREDLRPSTN